MEEQVKPHFIVKPYKSVMGHQCYDIFVRMSGELIQYGYIGLGNNFHKRTVDEDTFYDDGINLTPLSTQS